MMLDILKSPGDAGDAKDAEDAEDAGDVSIADIWGNPKDQTCILA